MRWFAYISGNATDAKTRSTVARVSLRARLILLVLISALSVPDVVEAKPQEVSFEGVRIAVDSKTSLAGGALAIRFGGEDFITTEGQAGRSVVMRLIKRPDMSEVIRPLLSPIVAAAIAAEDSRLLEAVIEAQLTTSAPQLNDPDDIWRQLMASSLGKKLVVDGQRRQKGQYSRTLCQATLVALEFGLKLELSESVSTRCLRGDVEQMVIELGEGHQVPSLLRRVRDAKSAFSVADRESIETAESLEACLRQVTEGETIAAYLDARARLSTRFLAPGDASQMRRALGVLDDSFLKRLAESAGNEQAILFLPQMVFERRSQVTHEIVLRVLKSLQLGDYNSLRRRDSLITLARFADRDSEIAAVFGEAMERVICDATANISARTLGEIVIALQDAGESVRRAIEPSVLSSIGDLIDRGDFDAAQALEHTWRQPIPISVRCGWFVRRNKAIIITLVIFVILGFCLKARRVSRSDSSSGLKPTRPGLPADYEEALKQVGLAPGVSLAEIKAAYRAAVKLHHPDRKSHATAEDQERFRQTLVSFERAIELHRHIH